MGSNMSTNLPDDIFHPEWQQQCVLLLFINVVSKNINYNHYQFVFIVFCYDECFNFNFIFRIETSAVVLLQKNKPLMFSWR